MTSTTMAGPWWFFAGASLTLFIALLCLLWGLSLRRLVDERNAALDVRGDALADSEERLRLAQEAAHFGTWERDLTTGEIDWSHSQAELFGLHLDSSRRSYAHFLELVHPDDRERLSLETSRAIRERTRFHTEFRIVRPDGSIRWLVGIGQASYDADGSPRRIIGLNLDVTERRRLEEQLLQAQKMESVGRLAGGVAHDFNNLLTAILADAELAERAAHERRDPAQNLANIRQAALRATALTRQLLAFARKQIIEPRAIDLGILIHDLERMLARLIGEDVVLKTHTVPGLWPVLADPGQIEQVLVNLVVNARDALSEGGGIEIRAGNLFLEPGDEVFGGQLPPGRYVELEVQDTGHGMTAEVQSHLFEPFFTTKPDGRGTGLGLATCYGIVKQSGGHIAAYSEPGRGTTFRILLPRVTGDAAMVRPLLPVLAELPAGQQELVLLVEDEPLVREVTEHLLTRLGYRVLAAPDGMAALAIAEERANEIDLVLTDVVMPQMGGRELVTQLTRICPRARILYTSGYTDDAIVREGVLQNDIAFLQKPFTTTHLAQKVREVLDHS